MRDVAAEGTADLSAVQIAQIFNAHGVNYSRSGLSGAAVDVLKLLPLFFELILSPALTEASFNKVRDQYRSVLISWQDNASMLAQRLQFSITHPGTVYDYTINDLSVALEALTVDDVRELHKNWAKPSQLIISAVGKVAKNRLHDLLYRSFGPSERSYAPAIAQTTSSSYVPVNKYVPLLRDQMIVGYARPSEVTPIHEDYAALTVIESTYFGGLGSRLYQLREQTGIFYASQGAFGSEKTGPALDMMYAIVNPDKVNRLYEMIDSLFDENNLQPLTQADLDAARKKIITKQLKIVSSSFMQAHYFAGLLVDGLSVDFNAQFLNKLNSLTVDEVNSVLRKYATTKNMSRFAVGRVNPFV
jgi:zinc protease